MVILAIDTATHAVGLALHDGAELIAEHHWVMRSFHTVQLAPEIAMILQRANCRVSSLSAVAVAQGPGSYTGLRIGLALAKGMALVHHLPIIAIPTLDILAYSQPARPQPMLAVTQVGRGRVAGLWYKWGLEQWKASGTPQVMSWDQLMEHIDTETYICGEIEKSAREKLREAPLAILAPPAFSLRRPGFLAELGWERLRAGLVDDPRTLAPLYLPTEGISGS